MQRGIALDKVRKLLLKAVHTGTPVEERKTCRRIADKLMAKYGISEMEVWSKTTIDDIPEEMQDDMMSDIYSKIDDFVGALERGQEKAVEKAVEKAEGYVKQNKEKIKDKVGDWLDGLFK